QGGHRLRPRAAGEADRRRGGGAVGGPDRPRHPPGLQWTVTPPVGTGACRRPLRAAARRAPRDGAGRRLLHRPRHRDRSHLVCPIRTVIVSLYFPPAVAGALRSYLPMMALWGRLRFWLELNRVSPSATPIPRPSGSGP